MHEKNSSSSHVTKMGGGGGGGWLRGGGDTRRVTCPQGTKYAGWVGGGGGGIRCDTGSRAHEFLSGRNWCIQILTMGWLTSRPGYKFTKNKHDNKECTDVQLLTDW